MQNIQVTKHQFLSVIAVIAGALAQAEAASADDETVIESSPGRYSESYKGPNGAQMEYRQEGDKVHKEYKDNAGVHIKEEANADSEKKVYEDKNCKQETVRNIKDGETKVTTSGDCSR